MTILDIGGIYSDQKCPICKGNYKDDNKSALRCPDHPQHVAGRLKVKIKGTCARFSSYSDARYFLDAKRLDIVSGKFQKKEKNLYEIYEGFIAFKEKLAEMDRIKTRTVDTYANRLRRILDSMGGHRKVSEVTYKSIFDFLYGTDWSVKSKYDSYMCFKEMVHFAHNMGDWPDLPKFPRWTLDIDRDMKKRNTLTKTEQEEVLFRIFENEFETRPRLFVAIKFLATYINVRPGELLGCNEDDYMPKEGILFVRNRKTSKTPKLISLTEDDNMMLKSLTKGFPGMALFRHEVDGSQWSGARFSPAMFYRSWKRACKDLGIEGVDLYGGTRHSSAVALYKEAGFSPEEIKKATGHRTSKAFSRYFDMDDDDVAEIHKAAAPGGKIEKVGIL